MDQNQSIFAAVIITWENFLRKKVKFRKQRTFTKKSSKSGRGSSLKKT